MIQVQVETKRNQRETDSREQSKSKRTDVQGENQMEKGAETEKGKTLTVT